MDVACGSAGSRILFTLIVCHCSLTASLALSLSFSLSACRSIACKSITRYPLTRPTTVHRLFNRIGLHKLLGASRPSCVGPFVAFKRGDKSNEAQFRIDLDYKARLQQKGQRARLEHARLPKNFSMFLCNREFYFTTRLPWESDSV